METVVVKSVLYSRNDIKSMRSIENKNVNVVFVHPNGETEEIETDLNVFISKTFSLECVIYCCSEIHEIITKHLENVM